MLQYNNQIKENIPNAAPVSDDSLMNLADLSGLIP